MKIAICGSSYASDLHVVKSAFDVGVELARNEVLVLTGAGHGYPLEAAKGAFSAQGKVLGFSPAKDPDEHDIDYEFPKEPFTQIEYTGMGIPGRNLALVTHADAVIIIAGQAGTLNEFSIAFKQRKPVGVLEGSGGVTTILKEVAKVCNTKKDEAKNVVYSHDPHVLVPTLIKITEKNLGKRF